MGRRATAIFLVEASILTLMFGVPISDGSPGPFLFIWFYLLSRAMSGTVGPASVTRPVRRFWSQTAISPANQQYVQDSPAKFGSRFALRVHPVTHFPGQNHTASTYCCPWGSFELRWEFSPWRGNPTNHRLGDSGALLFVCPLSLHPLCPGSLQHVCQVGSSLVLLLHW